MHTQAGLHDNRENSHSFHSQLQIQLTNCLQSGYLDNEAENSMGIMRTQKADRSELIDLGPLCIELVSLCICCLLEARTTPRISFRSALSCWIVCCCTCQLSTLSWIIRGCPSCPTWVITIPVSSASGAGWGLFLPLERAYFRIPKYAPAIRPAIHITNWANLLAESTYLLTDSVSDVSSFSASSIG